MTEQSANPLVLTLTLASEAQLYFTVLRRKHFPAERNFLDAHLTLFHQLPAGDDALISDVKHFAAQYKQFTMLVSNVVSIGNGAAFKVESDELYRLHLQMQVKWHHVIIPQDKQKLWPHITIQNKVPAPVAKALIQELQVNFAPFEIKATGLSLWEYLGGPWAFKEIFRFNKED